METSVQLILTYLNASNEMGEAGITTARATSIKNINWFLIHLIPGNFWRNSIICRTLMAAYDVAVDNNVPELEHPYHRAIFSQNMERKQSDSNIPNRLPIKQSKFLRNMYPGNYLEK